MPRKRREHDLTESQKFDATLNSAFDRILHKSIATGLSEQQAAERLSDAVQPAVKSAAGEIVQQLDIKAPKVLKETLQSRRGFERRLARTWRRGFEALEKLLLTYVEYGSEFYASGVADDSIRSQQRFRALVELHARSCRVAREIQALLHAGLPDGALARWRTLHEIAVVALVLAQEDESVAHAYLEHGIIQRWKLMTAWNAHAKRLGSAPATAAEVSELTAQFDEVVARRGRAFKGDYGWASELLSNQRPTFADLEQRSRLERFRPYYSWASGGVHAGANSFVVLGAESGFGGRIAAGATNRGLADPGQNTAISLTQISAAAMVSRQSVFGSLATHVIGRLAKECQDGFMADHKAVELRVKNEQLARSRTPP